MIGSHDSITYLPTKYKIFEWFSFLWRTQNKKLLKQAKAGVTYFDIRVRKIKHGWCLCHGLVDFDKEFQTLNDLIVWVTIVGSQSNKRPLIRLILERGDSILFEEQALSIAKKYSNVSFIGIKKGWKVLLDRDPVIIDLSFTPWLSGNTFKQNLKRIWSMIKNHQPLTIKSYAKRNVITEEMLQSNKVYFMDYV